MTNIPYYLNSKLSSSNLLSYVINKNYDELSIFKWLKDHYPSISYNALYDLYAIYHNLAINSLNQDIQQQLIVSFKSLLPSYQPLTQDKINNYLDCALNMAQKANKNNEVPIGAVIVFKDIIIGEGFNQTVTTQSIINHAEIIAIKQASEALNTHRLHDCDLYITIEPCIMCIGAILHSRIRRVIFGAYEPKTGAVISQINNIINNRSLNSHTEFIGAIDNDKYSKLIKEFFLKKR